MKGKALVRVAADKALRTADIFQSASGKTCHPATGPAPDGKGISTMSDGPKVFFAHLREMTERFDPHYHSPVFANNLLGIRRKPFRRIGDCCELSDETWDKAALFHDQFPYIEIGAINTELGETTEPEILPTSEAPSRAQMVVRRGDILASMTRPTRNAIARVSDSIDVAIASTGFAVVRKVDDEVVLRDYFFHVLRFGLCTMQFDQRCSGGNYPAITKDDFRKTIIPVPSLDIQKRIVEELDAAYAAKRKADEKAAQLLASIDDIVLSELGIPSLPPPDTSLRTRMFTVSTRMVAQGRLDASYYMRRYIDFSRVLSSSKYQVGRVSDFGIDVFQGVCRNLDVKDGFHLLKVKNIQNDGTIDYMDVEPVSDVPYRKRLEKGDIISPFIGAAILNFKFGLHNGGIDGKYAVDNNTGVFRALSNDIAAEYLWVYFQTVLTRIQLERLVGGGGVPYLGTDYARQIEIVVPPLSIQHRIVEKVSAIREKVKLLKSVSAQTLADARTRVEIQLLGELRDCALPHYLGPGRHNA